MSLADLALPILRRLDAETAHRLTVWSMKHGFGPKLATAADPRLAMQLFNLDFPSPIGLAAGFDKNAETILPSFDVGFGFVEIGTVTPRPQQGNPRPRLFRLVEDRAVINRMGFNNDGMEAAAHQLALTVGEGQRPGPVGANIGKNKDSEDAAADYAACAAHLSPFADYLTINVSSPNTPGLRALQSPEHLRELLSAVVEAANRPLPVLIKIAPDLADADLQAIATVARDPAVSGLIVSNTTIARPDSLRSHHKAQTGGLSGAPLFEPSTRTLRRVYELCDGAVPLIGVGGVSDAETAYAKIRAGASLIQLYTALVFQGPGLVQRILDGLPALLDADGFGHLSEAVGADHRN